MVVALAPLPLHLFIQNLLILDVGQQAIINPVLQRDVLLIADFCLQDPEEVITVIELVSREMDTQDVTPLLDRIQDATDVRLAQMAIREVNMQKLVPRGKIHDKCVDQRTRAIGELVVPEEEMLYARVLEEALEEHLRHHQQHMVKR